MNMSLLRTTLFALGCLPLMASAFELTPQQLANVALKTTTVSERSVAESFHVSGTLRADQKRIYMVAPMVESIVTSLSVVANDRVKKGDMLAYLHSNSLGKAQAEYLESLARYQLAESDLKRIKGLRADGVVSQSRLLEVESRFKMARVMRDQRYRGLTLVGLSEAQIEQLSVDPGDIADLLIYSPVDGVLLDVNVENGQMLQAGEAAFRIADLAVLWAEVRIPLSRLASVVMGSEVMLSVPAYPDQRFSGVLDSLGGEVDSASQTVIGRVVVDNSQQLLKPGMYLQADLQGRHSSGIMVPHNALFRRGNDSYLFVVEGGDNFTPVKVVTGLKNADFTQIVSGISENAKVVIEGVADLKGHWLYQGEE